MGNYWHRPGQADPSCCFAFTVHLQRAVSSFSERHQNLASQQVCFTYRRRQKSSYEKIQANRNTALLKSAVSGTCHRIHTTKKIKKIETQDPMLDAQCGPIIAARRVGCGKRKDLDSLRVWSRQKTLSHSRSQGMLGHVLLSRTPAKLVAAVPVASGHR